MLPRAQRMALCCHPRAVVGGLVGVAEHGQQPPEPLALLEDGLAGAPLAGVVGFGVFASVAWMSPAKISAR